MTDHEQLAARVEAGSVKRWSRVINRGIAMLDYLANDRTAFSGTGTPQSVLSQLRAVETEMLRALAAQEPKP